MGVHNVESKDAFYKAIKEHKVVVLDVFATWCGPCKVISPEVVKFSDHFKGAYFCKVDVDEVSDLAADLRIRAMPTFRVYKDGKMVEEVVGANPTALKAAISTHASENPVAAATTGKAAEKDVEVKADL